MKTSPSKSALFSMADSPFPGPYGQPDLITSGVTGTQELSVVPLFQAPTFLLGSGAACFLGHSHFKKTASLTC